jgi:hypothetical protein
LGKEILGFEGAMKVHRLNKQIIEMRVRVIINIMVSTHQGKKLFWYTTKKVSVNQEIY